MAPGEGRAQAPLPLTANRAQSTASIIQFWTPKRLLEARPIEMRPSVDQFLSLSHRAESQASTHTGVGAPPIIMGNGNLTRQLHSPKALGSTENSSAKTTDNLPPSTSSEGAYFTTSRVFPDAATTTYPYLTVGQLVFHNPVSNQDSYCSASVLRPRVVVTAGHCVYHAGPTEDDPSGNRYFYSNWMFTPAYNNGAAPLGTWTWQYVIVSGYWSTGKGTVPNAQDIAIFEMVDNNNQRIGDFTGYLGYAIGSLSPNHLTILGYPCNIDSCTKMQSTNAQSFAGGGKKTVIYGSAQRGGTSGGPWIQDFGVAGSGAPTGTALNWLKSVSSYGPIAAEPKYQGGSSLMGNVTSGFLSLLNTVCNHRQGNC
jgi:V8-like Glu-specific endopeptidase